MNTQLRIVNVSNSEARLNIWIGGKKVTGSPLTIPVGGSVRKTFAGIDKGPVKIVSNQNIVAAAQVISKSAGGVPLSYSEMMALPNKHLDTTYWLPWYDSKTQDTRLLIANASSSRAARVRVWISGTEVTGSPFSVRVGASLSKTFPGINKGPVRIKSNVPIVVSERVIFESASGLPVSFSEMLALPNKLLDSTYWLPWYTSKNNVDTQLRIANVGPSAATVHVRIGGVEVMGSPYIIPVKGGLRKTFAGIDQGPLQIESDADDARIVASARVIYRVNGVATSSSEMMALPDGLLDSAYWFPWYNNKTLDTQLRFGVP
jgi:hypothetical protein